jgi:hypothetical protein
MEIAAEDEGTEVDCISVAELPWELSQTPIAMAATPTTAIPIIFLYIEMFPCFSLCFFLDMPQNGALKKIIVFIGP